MTDGTGNGEFGSLGEVADELGLDQAAIQPVARRSVDIDGHQRVSVLVWGEAETKRQMLWYTLILVPLTILPATFGALGRLYFVSAAGLGLIFLWGVLRVMRTKEWISAAWRLYRFSLLYLALLFVAMVLDRVIRP